MNFEYEFLNRFEQPYFFDGPSDPALKEMQALIRKGLEKDTETLTVEIEQWRIDAMEKNLLQIGWTVEESMILFLKWTVLFPERASAWLKHIAAERMRQIKKPYREEDKIPVSRFEADFDAVMDDVQRDGIKIIVDTEGKEDAVIMAWWFNRAIMQLTDPEHADERIAEIEKACAEYKEPLNV